MLLEVAILQIVVVNLPETAGDDLTICLIDGFIRLQNEIPYVLLRDVLHQ